MRYAVIDLGTNTFNLLIAEDTNDGKYKILLNTKEAVKLGEGGINNRIITEAAFERGISAIGRHFEKINNHKVNYVKAFATSAIRDAANGNDFAAALKLKFSLDISVISGDEEAGLICKGVRQSMPFKYKRFLILDIGGGSNEFIIGDDINIYWKKSFKLGMARLLERFQPSSPVTPEEIKLIEVYLSKELPELIENVNNLHPDIFIGASGSFDSFVSMLDAEKLLAGMRTDAFHEISPDNFRHIHNKLIHTTKHDRENMVYLEPVRKDMIVLAAIFVNFVFKQFRFEKIYQSAYSLKEGALAEMVESTKNNSTTIS